LLGQPPGSVATQVIAAQKRFSDAHPPSSPPNLSTAFSQPSLYSEQAQPKPIKTPPARNVFQAREEVEKVRKEAGMFNKALRKAPKKDAVLTSYFDNRDIVCSFSNNLLRLPANSL
jgi:hypothetical protein